MTVYVLTLDGEPQYVTRNLDKIQEECEKWFNDNRDNYLLQHDFYLWVEGREYPNTNEGYDAAWADYAKEQFNDGTWGDYAWYETSLID
jgi:hypothetical protein